MYPIEYTCTRNETTVTTRSITLESGSTSAATSTWKSPTPIQRYSVTVVACPSLAMTSKKIAMDSSADAPIAPDAIQPVACPSQRFPKSPLMRNAASGNAGMSQTSGTNVPAAAVSAAVMGSPAHRARFVDVDDRTGAVGREHDGEPDGDLGGRHDEDEGHEDAAALIDGAVAAREGDEGEVRGVQHELDAHEDDDGVAPHEHAGAPDEEERRGYTDVRADRDPSLHLGLLVVPLHEHDRADEGREQQHGGDLERECEVTEQARRERHEVAASRQGTAIPELEREEHHGERDEQDEPGGPRRLFLEEERVVGRPLRREHDAVEDEDRDRADVDEDLERRDRLRTEKHEHPGDGEEGHRHEQRGRRDRLQENDHRAAADHGDGEGREEDVLEEVEGHAALRRARSRKVRSLRFCSMGRPKTRPATRSQFTIAIGHRFPGNARISTAVAMMFTRAMGIRTFQQKSMS